MFGTTYYKTTKPITFTNTPNIILKCVFLAEKYRPQKKKKQNASEFELKCDRNSDCITCWPFNSAIRASERSVFQYQTKK